MIIILLLLVTSVQAWHTSGSYKPSYQFCNKLLSTNGSCIEQSIYCKAYMPTDKKTGDYSEIIPLDKRLKNFIVDRYNFVRNEFACGNASNIHNQTFPQAQNMSLLKWNIELAWSASQLAGTCISSKVCPSTDSFLMAGQSIYMHQTFEIGDDIGEMLNKMLVKWYNARLFLDPADIFNFREKGLDVDLYEIGQIINDKTLNVGCALNNCGMERDLHYYFLVCNYGAAVYKNQSLYEVGRRNCLVDSKYKCLCKIAGNNRKSEGFRMKLSGIGLLLCVLLSLR